MAMATSSCSSPWVAPFLSTATCNNGIKFRSPWKCNDKRSLFNLIVCKSSSEHHHNHPFANGSPLHDALDACGVDTHHARAARKGFLKQIDGLSVIEKETSIAINRPVDLGRAALQIAAEDDALISHSSVPLPVDSFVERLDDLSMDFFAHHLPLTRPPPDAFIQSLERYFYVHKGFRRTSMNHRDVRDLYLHSVLTRRTGSLVMIAVIYSEMVKMLRLYGVVDFDIEIYFPHDLVSLPQGYDKQKSKVSDEPHIMTPLSLLVEMLRDLKDAFWPFQYGRNCSLFLRAASATNFVTGSSIIDGIASASNDNASGFEVASMRAAQHRLGRGVWTGPRFGDIRRALAGKICFCISTQTKKFSSDLNWALEEDAERKLVIRLKLISMEKGWSKPSTQSLWGTSEPW
ncbi:hypothetical protein AMTRI_Chr01g129200 [Amborella trichopoda]